MNQFGNNASACQKDIVVAVDYARSDRELRSYTFSYL